METSNDMARGLHTWAFYFIMALSSAYLILAIIDSSVALSIDIGYAATVLITSVIGAKER